MRKSVSDSKEEEKLFKRLKTYWSKYLDVFPQLPPRNIFGYDEIMKSGMKVGAKDFLLNTIGEYFLAMKTKKILSFDWKNWAEAREKAH